MKTFFLTLFAAAILFACGGGSKATTETTSEPAVEAEAPVDTTAAAPADTLAVSDTTAAE